MLPELLRDDMAGRFSCSCDGCFSAGIDTRVEWRTMRTMEADSIVGAGLAHGDGRGDGAERCVVEELALVKAARREVLQSSRRASASEKAG